MSTLLKKIAVVTFIASVAPTIAMAKISILQDYIARIGFFKQQNPEDSVVCDAGDSVTKPSCNSDLYDCTEYTKGTKTCYKCTVNRDKLPFEGGCPSELTSDASCTVGNKTYHKCGCPNMAGELYEEGKLYFNENVFDNVEPSEFEDGLGGRVVCYDKSAWTCKTGYEKKDFRDLGLSTYENVKEEFNFSSTLNDLAADYIVYRAFSNIKNDADVVGSIVCIDKDYIEVKEPLWEADSSGNCSNSITCASVGTQSAALTGIPYCFYMDCVRDSGNCVSDLGDCGLGSENAITTLRNQTMTCKEITGCAVGKKENGTVCYGDEGKANILVASYDGGTGKNVIASKSFGEVKTAFGGVETDNIGRYTCVEFKGCGSSYEEFVPTYIPGQNVTPGVFVSGVDDPKVVYGEIMMAYDYNSCPLDGSTNFPTCSATDNAYSYQVCRKATGCKVTDGYYDTSCDGSCGWLKYFMP